MTLVGIIGGTWCPLDGLVDPNGLLQGYVSQARRRGVTLVTSARVNAITITGGRVQRVVTDSGGIDTPAVVIATGPWSAQVGALAGVNLPIQPIRRQISLIEREQIAEHAAALGLQSIPAGGVRSNIETFGINLIAVVGRESIGLNIFMVRFVAPAF